MSPMIMRWAFSEAFCRWEFAAIILVHHWGFLGRGKETLKEKAKKGFVKDGFANVVCFGRISALITIKYRFLGK